MATRRVVLLGLLLGSLVTGCGGTSTRLVTVKSGTGSGPIDFRVKNLTDVPINTFYLAKTERVEATGKERIEPNSPEGDALWGPDLSGQAIPIGETQPIPVTSPGNWDARAVDRDGREQLITRLRLAAGGKYILELYDGNWRVYSQ
jgi:hypothetical protein